MFFTNLYINWSEFVSIAVPTWWLDFGYVVSRGVLFSKGGTKREFFVFEMLFNKKSHLLDFGMD